MTEVMKQFVKCLEKARIGEDEGIKQLKHLGLKLGTVKSNRYGGVYLAYTPVLKLGDYSLNKWCIQTIYQSAGKDLYFEQKIKIASPENINKESVLTDSFDICIIHNMERIDIGCFEEFEILVEKSIDIFVVTKYGCFDLYKGINTNIFLEDVIEDSFKNENIIICPSNQSALAKDLNVELTKTLISGEECLSSKLSIDYKLTGLTFFDKEVKFSNSVYINGRYFCEYKCNYLNEAEIIVCYGNDKKSTFKSLLSIFGIKTKISSKMLAKCINWNLVDDKDLETRTSNFNSSLLSYISFSIVKNGMDEIKNKHYFDLVKYKNELRIKDIICEKFISYKMTFKERQGMQFPFGKLLFLNAEFLEINNTNYNVALYNQYIISNDNRIYKINEILVENIEKQFVSIMTLVEVATQIQMKDSKMLLPILYFIPCNIVVGTMINDIIQSSKTIKLILSEQVKKYIYEKIVEEFGILNNISSSILKGDKTHFNSLDLQRRNSIFEIIKKIAITEKIDEDIMQFMEEII